MYATEPRQIARHRAPRRRVTSVLRPYPMVAAVLVGLASVPMLAAVLAGSASLNTTSTPRSPIVADQSQVPVVISGVGGTTSAPSAGTAASGTPVPSPAPTSTALPETRDQATAPQGAVTQRSTTKPHRTATRTGGSSGSVRQGSAPTSTGSKPETTSSPLPGAGAPPLPLPTIPQPPLPSPSLSGILPSLAGVLPSLTADSAPKSGSPATSGAAATAVGSIGDLLGLDRLLDGR